MKTVIELAKEAGLIVATGFDDGPSMAISIPTGSWGVDEIERFAELVRADERAKYKWNSLGPGQMELSLMREHNGDLFEVRRRFSAEEVILGSDFMVEATATKLEVEMEQAIRARSNT